MTQLILLLINASIFSISRMGEDQSIFFNAFFGNLNKARIEFTLNPEVNLLNENSSVRGLFWTNPFTFRLNITITYNVLLTAGNRERFNQTFDVYLEHDPLNIHLVSKGGIEEAYCQINSRVGNMAEAFCRGSFLFGSTREIWRYEIGDYFIDDTFSYKYKGTIFSGGIKLFIFSISFEGLSHCTMTKTDTTEITHPDLPECLSIGLYHNIEDYQINAIYERSFWSDSQSLSPNRFIIGIARGNLGLAYVYNPWYISGVMENGIEFKGSVPIKNIGYCSLNFLASLRNRSSLREIVIRPEINLTVEEIFARRKK